MHGDHSRITFDKTKQYSRVLAQQGRVFLEADINEQAAVFAHALQALTRDLLGPHGVPEIVGATSSDGFRIAAPTAAGRGFEIAPGSYYVDGIRCENIKEKAAYFDQPHYFVNTTDDRFRRASSTHTWTYGSVRSPSSMIRSSGRQRWEVRIPRRAHRSYGR